MNDPIENIDTETLRMLLRECQGVVRLVCDMEPGSAIVVAIQGLLTAEDMAFEFETLMVADRELAGRVLRSALAALANSQSILAIQSELERRAAPNN